MEKRSGLVLGASTRIGAFNLITGAILFGISGTFDYPGAWILILTFVGLACAAFIHYSRKDPEFLRKRMDYREKEKKQKAVILLSLLPYAWIFVVPALDRRFHWSAFSWITIAIGLALIAFGVVLLVIVFQANRYAARTVKIQEGQSVIDTGPYAVVRHPMYSASIVLFAGMPLVLQSVWGLIAIPFLLAILVFRILNEEKFLKAELPGYEAYMKKVRWRMLPFIW